MSIFAAALFTFVAIVAIAVINIIATNLDRDAIRFERRRRRRVRAAERAAARTAEAEAKARREAEARALRAERRRRREAEKSARRALRRPVRIWSTGGLTWEASDFEPRFSLGGGWNHKSTAGMLYAVKQTDDGFAVLVFEDATRRWSAQIEGVHALWEFQRVAAPWTPPSNIATAVAVTN